MFRQAKPIWAAGRTREQNTFIAFESRTGSLAGAELYVAAVSFYRLFVNGTFVAFGPARTATGYARVDVIPLDRFDGDENRIRIEVAGYYCRSLSTCRTPSFLCAELRRGDEVLAYTGSRDFTALSVPEKMQKVERYSFQRHFGEIWDFTADAPTTLEVELCADAPAFIPRVAPLPYYEEIPAARAACRGTFDHDDTLPCREHRYSAPIDAYWGCFEEDEIPRKPFRWVQKQRQTITEYGCALPLTLHAGEYALFDLTRLECGFLTTLITAHEACDLVITYSEYCEGDTFAFTNMNVHNVVEVLMRAGDERAFRSFEPYTARFIAVFVREGALSLRKIGISTFQRDIRAVRRPAFERQAQRDIYEAALRTFAHNAVDLYTDCPSRERAGWLCDSYFTANAEQHFFGDVPVEDAFLENFRLCPPLDDIPHGMLPECYPADVRIRDFGGEFIPQWCMWYVLEVEEYCHQRRPSADREAFRPSVMGIVTALARYENEDGLLERLPAWNFVEWSDANKWTMDVNYPTNFLYAGVLLAAYRLYGDSALAEKAERIRKKTAALSFDGTLFTDNAVRGEDGLLRNTGNTSEAGQYYAILFGNIDLDDPRYAALSHFVENGFAGAAEGRASFVGVNAFIGLYLRLKTLLHLHLYRQILDEVEGFFGGMSAKTGTLWEYRQMVGSFDHGFASYAAYAMCTALDALKK